MIITTDHDQLNDLADELPQGYIRFIFNVYQKQSLFQAEDSVLRALEKLAKVFPTSAFLKTQEALLYYHAKRTSISCVYFAFADKIHRL